MEWRGASAPLQSVPNDREGVKMKVKDIRFRVKAGPDDGLKEGEFEAYASVFGNKDSYGDIVMPGAFAESLDEWKESGFPIPLLFGHNMSDPDFNIGEVLEAKEDEHGLFTRNLLDLENPKAVQTYRLIKGRRINQMSFAYDVLEGGEGERQREDGSKEYYYELRKLKLYEVSVVPIGANQETEITAVKAAELARRQLEQGAVLEPEIFKSLLQTYHALGDLLIAGNPRQDSASGTGPAKSEEPGRAKDEEPSQTPPAQKLAAQLKLLSLEGE